MSADKQKCNVAWWSLMLWKCRGAYFKIPLTFAVLFSTFAYCHSKETLQRSGIFTRGSWKSIFRWSVFPQWHLSCWLCAIKRQQKGTIYTDHGQMRYRKEQNKQSQTPPGLPQEEHGSTMSACCCNIKILRFGIIIWGVPLFPCWPSRLCGTCVTRQ